MYLLTMHWRGSAFGFPEGKLAAEQTDAGCGQLRFA